LVAGRPFQQPLIDELKNQARQPFLVQLLQQPAGREPVVPPPSDALRPGPAQDIDEVHGTEALAQPRDARENLLRGRRRVRQSREFAHTDVAGAAISLVVRLSEELRQPPVPARHAAA
jgi:hypothetical protein